MIDGTAAVQALVRLLEVFALSDEAAVRQRALDAAVESFDAAVACIVCAGRVIESTGLRPDDQRLIEMAAAEIGSSTTHLEPLGLCHVLVLPIVGRPDTRFVLARTSEAFSGEEAVVVRAMVRLMGLGVGTVAAFDEQRRVATELERQVVANQALTDRLEHRHRSLVERVLRIQRRVISRNPTDDPMDVIVEQAGELFDGDVVAIRRLDLPAGEKSLWTVNADAGTVERLTDKPTEAGISIRAMTQGRLVVDPAYQPVYKQDGSGPRGAMSTPVHCLGEAVGAMTVVGAADRIEPHDEEDWEALVILSGYVSVALSAAATNAALQDALERAEWRAVHDDLTGLPNRRQVLDVLDARLRSGESPTVFYVDVDGFKTANDLYGHKAGDFALIEIAERLVESVRGEEVVGRLAGDEFAVVLPTMTREAATLVAQRVSARLGGPFDLGGQQIRLPVSIGVTVSPADTAEGLLEAADFAMHRAKGLTGSRISFYDDVLRTQRLRRIEIEQQLRKATVDMVEFSVFYQPIVSEPLKDVRAFEALVRWTNPVVGSVAPDEFIPIAEQIGLIAHIDMWVLQTVIAQSSSDPTGGSKFSVNMSPASFLAPELPGNLLAAFADASVSPDRLAIEITERVMLDDPIHVANNIAAVQRLGVAVVVDDFGTGYSSLSYLRSLNINGLKIDRSFVVGAQGDVRGRAVLAAVISLANDLGLEPVAEGIETSEQLDLVHDLGCNRYQGYFFGRPLPFPSQADEVVVG